MIELAASVFSPLKTGVLAPVGGAGTGDFSLLLACLPAAATEVPALPGPGGKRQAIARDGKGLPDEAAGEAADEDLSKDLIWLPVGLLAPVPLPATVRLAVPVGGPMHANVIAPPAAMSVPVPVTTPADAGVQLSGPVAQSLPSPDWTPASAGVILAEGGAKPVDPAPTKGALVVPRRLEIAKVDLPVRVDATAVAQRPQPAQPQQPLLQPAGQAFATAIAAAVHAQVQREREPETRAPLAIAAAALEAVHAPAVVATADAKQGALDLRQDTGLQGMIDHIEVLRDGADAGDTRIRLVPDALGAIDVSVRKDGERVHVHFAAENAASARLIAEAQPRLAELADARGLKLGDATVDAGGGEPRRHAPTPSIPAAPVPAMETNVTVTDDRIA